MYMNFFPIRKKITDSFPFLFVKRRANYLDGYCCCPFFRSTLLCFNFGESINEPPYSSFRHRPTYDRLRRLNSLRLMLLCCAIYFYIYISTSVVYINIYLYFLYILISKNSHYLIILYILIMQFNCISSVFPPRFKIYICRECTFSGLPNSSATISCMHCKRILILYLVFIWKYFYLKLWPNTANYGQQIINSLIRIIFTGFILLSNTYDVCTNVNYLLSRFNMFFMFTRPSWYVTLTEEHQQLSIIHIIGVYICFDCD